MAKSSDLLSQENTLWMKGVSALMIMLMHFIMQIDGYPRFLNIFGSLGVAVFLFLSGFGLNESFKEKGLDNYWRKRFVRVILPCWIVFVFRLPFLEKFNISQFVHNIVFIDSDLWFVVYILRWYIVYWIAKKFLPKHTTAILAIFSFYSIFQQQLWSEQSFSFFVGYIFSQKYEKIKTISNRGILIFTLVCVTYGIIFLLLKELPYIRTFIGTLPFNVILLNIKLPISMFFITLPKLLPTVKKLRFVNWCGKVSYELYIVHYNFMPYTVRIPLVLLYSVYSLVISFVFYKINQNLRRSFCATLAAIFYIGINYNLITKYSMRVTPIFGYISVCYSLVLATVYLFFTKNRVRTFKYNESFFWILLASAIVVMLIVQYHFDPMEIKVDRWSAIENPLSALFHGHFPYLAKTHLGGNASPFPIWMIFHMPFWILGNVGLSVMLATVLFVYSVKKLYGNIAGVVAIALLMLSVCLWYETIVRSDLITNFLLLAAFMNMLLYKGMSFSSHLYTISICCGLWLSTRVSVAFPLFIMLLPTWMDMPKRKKITSLMIVVLTFCLTFLPLVVWDYDSLFFSENNPFSLQTRQGRPIDSLALLFVALLLSLRWRGDIKKMHLCIATILLLIPIISYGHNMFVYDNWNSLYLSAYDITYLDAALPFCVILMSIQVQQSGGVS